MLCRELGTGYLTSQASLALRHVGMGKQSQEVTRLQSALVMPASVTWAQSLSVPSLCGAKVRLVVTGNNQSLLLPP